MGYPSAAQTGAGCQFKRGDGGDPETFATISEVQAVKQSGSKLDMVDCTNMDSQGNYREFKPTLFDAGTFTLTVNYIPQDASQIALQSDYDGKVLRNFQVVIPGASGGTWSFSAYVESISRSYELDKLLVMDVGLKVSGKPTFA
jgi:predicted secreted protein